MNETNFSVTLYPTPVCCGWWSADDETSPLKTLPPLPPTLRTLDCTYSSLRALPLCLPPGLRELHCGNTPIRKLPPLPNTLEILECGRTPLTALPPLPPTLTGLYCSNTRITTLPFLPPTLHILYCASTRISCLPPLPNHLHGLNCSHTRITELPPLPTGLAFCLCSFTNLREVPLLPESVLVCDFVGCRLFPYQQKPYESGIDRYHVYWKGLKQKTTSRIASLFLAEIQRPAFLRRRLRQAIRRILKQELGRPPTEAELAECETTRPMPVEFFEVAALNYDSYSCVAVKK